jgi:hypothetical protein
MCTIKDFDFDMFDLSKEEASKTALIKKDNELFIEKENKHYPCFAFRHNGKKFIASKDKGVLFSISSKDISKKAQSFLQTLEGVSFAIKQIKESQSKEDFLNKLNRIK